MKTLNLPPLLAKTSAAPGGVLQTSLLFQMFSIDRAAIPLSTLHQALDTFTGFDVNETDGNGRNLLIAHLGRYSAPHSYGNEEFDEAKLMAASSVHKTTGKAVMVGEDPVNFAPAPHVMLALRLLDLGVNPWHQDAEGRDALDQAMHLMWPVLLDRLLSDPRAPTAEQMDARRRTSSYNGGGVARPLLHVAVMERQLALTERLIAHGLNINAVDQDGQTPLFWVNSLQIAEVLLKAGADVSIQANDGLTAADHWAKQELNTGVLPALQKMVAPYERAGEGDPVALRQRLRTTLYSMATTRTKGDVLNYMREHGFTVDDVEQTHGSALDRRLVTTVMTHLMTNEKRSLAVAQHLLERSKWWTSDDPRVNDVLFTAWMGALTNLSSTVANVRPKFLNKVYEHVQHRYAWKTEQGMVNFLDDFLPWLERQDHQPLSTTRGVIEMLHTLVFGQLVDNRRTDSEEHQVWKKRAQHDPRIRMYEDTTYNSTAVYQSFVDTSWVGKTRTNGWSYGGSLASLAANGYSSTSSDSANLIRVLRLMMKGDVVCPKVPHDGMLLNTMLAILPAYVVKPNIPGESTPVFDIKNQIDAWTQKLLSEGVTVDNTLPYQKGRMVRLANKRPALAILLEQHALLQAIQPSETNHVPAPAANVARRRL